MLAIQSISGDISSEACLDAEHNLEVDRPYIGINPKGGISHLRTRNTDCLATHVSEFSRGITLCFVFCLLYSSTG